MLVPFYLATGAVCEYEGYPESFADWTKGDPIDDERKRLISAIESSVNAQVLSTRVLADDVNLVGCFSPSCYQLFAVLTSTSQRPLKRC